MSEWGSQPSANVRTSRVRDELLCKHGINNHFYKLVGASQPSMSSTHSPARCTACVSDVRPVLVEVHTARSSSDTCTGCVPPALWPPAVSTARRYPSPGHHHSRHHIPCNIETLTTQTVRRVLHLRMGREEAEVGFLFEFVSPFAAVVHRQIRQHRPRHLAQRHPTSDHAIGPHETESLEGAWLEKYHREEKS